MIHTRKHIALLLTFFLLSLPAQSTEWFAHLYEFPYFKNHAEQLLGSEVYVPDMFPMAIKLNDYVKEKIQKGELKDKPVIYDLYYMQLNRDRFLLEIYETPVSYRINITSRENYMFYFNYEELIRIIDYFAHPAFAPFYCGRSRNDIAWTRQQLFRKIDPSVGNKAMAEKETYEVYSAGEMSIRYKDNGCKVFAGENELNVSLHGTVSRPVIVKDRILFADETYFYVYEKGVLIKRVPTRGLLWQVQTESNILSYQSYPDWINFVSDSGEVKASYCYSKNRFYELSPY